MRARLKYVLCVFGLLASVSEASHANDLHYADTSVAATEVPGDADLSAGYPATASSSGSPDTQPSGTSVQDGPDGGGPIVPDSSRLGQERAELLIQLNKSLRVDLPPAEFMTQLDSGFRRVENLSLFDSMVLSLGYSNEVAASSAHLDTSEYQAAAALGPLLPHVDLRDDSGQEYSNPSSLTTLPYYAVQPYDTHHRTDSQLTIRQALMDLPSYFERQRQNFLLQSAQHSLSDIQERVAYDTLISFLKLIQLRLNVVLTENYRAELQKLLEYMTARVQAGGGTKADMQRVRGRVLNTTSAVVEARGAYESGLVEFKRLTGVVPTSIVIPGNLLPVLPKDFDTAMTTAIQNNFQLQAALRDEDSVVEERRAMQGKFSPRFDIELSAISTYNAGGVAGSAPLPNNTLYPTQNDRRAMFVVSWNLLNGGADLMQAKALESKRLEYEYHARDIQRKLEESLRINFNTLRAVNSQVDAVKQEMESNDIVLAAFNEQLFAANRSLLDVLDAYQRQYNSRTELTRLLVAEATAGLEMLRNMGKLQEGIAALH